MRALFWILAAGSAFTSPAAEFSARLDTRLTSYTTTAGSEFRATVIEAPTDGSRILIPEGATLLGRVVSVRSVGLGVRRERAEMALEVHSWQVPGGSPMPCDVKLTGIDNARESTTSDGRIRGVLAAGGPSGLARGFWRMPSQAVLHRPFTRLIGIGAGGLAPVVTLGLMGVRWAALRFPEPEIELPAGSELNLDLISRAPDAPEFPAEQVHMACARNYSSLPRELQRTNGKLADDVVNILFSGTREQLTSAFAAAGWVVADPLNKRTFMRMYHAWTSMKGYPTAPVSRLLYDGRDPDLVYQKSFNTVSRRHHVRIWRIPGRDLWVGAATHDVGITFEFKANVLTHRIDPQIDRERTKLHSDLRNAGCVAQAGLLPVPLDDIGTRLIETDGHVLRLSVQSCEPRNLTVQSIPVQPGGRLSRIARRLALETKHYVVRDNWIYWGYRGIRASGEAIVAKTRRERPAVEVASQVPVTPPPAQPPRGM